MERVTFLVEETNERLSCMLNPETILMQRSSGVKPRESLSGIVSSNNKGDNPILFTGSGYTTFELELVFDVSLAGSSINSQDVRDLTRPIWNLSENQQRDDHLYRPALCRFIWGKSWNIPGVISSVAEKLESFSPQGVPRRSWLKLRLIRVQEQQPSFLDEFMSFVSEFINIEALSSNIEANAELIDAAEEMLEIFHERIDLVAYYIIGEACRWRNIAIQLDITNPLEWLDEPVSDQDDTDQETQQ